MTDDMLNIECGAGARLEGRSRAMSGNTPGARAKSYSFAKRKRVLKTAWMGKNRSREGSCIIELGAALTMIIPAIVVVFYLIWQVLCFFMVYQQMSTLAQNASRRCAILYGTPGGCLMAPPGSAEITLHGGAIELAPYSAWIGQLRIPAVVLDDSQFTFKFCPPVQEPPETDILIRRPGFVTVTISSTNTCFPNPDILHLRNRLKLPFAVSSTSLLD